MSAASLSENPVFKRARGEKVLVGAKIGPSADPTARRPVSQAELEMRYYELEDGTESVMEEDTEGGQKKKRSKKTEHGKQPQGLRQDQLDNLVDEIMVLGLTPRELKIALENLLSNITPGNLTVNQLLEAIQTEVAQAQEATTEEGQAQ